MIAAVVVLVTVLGGAGLVRRVRRRWVVVTVEGSSMAPTLRDGDVVLARRCRPAELSVGQLVVVECPVPPAARPDWTWPDPDESPGGRRWMVKRLAALAGEPWPPACEGRADRLPEGAVAVLGDNAAASTDSRQMGAIPVDRLLGVVVRRIAPDRRAVTPDTSQDVSAK
ncbi:S26 family signal peptidase [Kitasatospora sp. NPDC004240]